MSDMKKRVAITAAVIGEAAVLVAFCTPSTARFFGT